MFEKSRSGEGRVEMRLYSHLGYIVTRVMIVEMEIDKWI